MYRKTIDVLQEDTRDKQIIDLRSEEDFEKETYPGAMNLYWEDLVSEWMRSRRTSRYI